MQSRLLAFFGLVLFLVPAALGQNAEPIKVDVCVYGGTCAGVMAAVTAVKLGKTVILIEPGRHLGGLTSGGLGQTDFGNKAVIGGISREFYRRVGKFYNQAEAWQFQPHHAEQVFDGFIAENKVRVMKEHRLRDLKKEGTRIVSITLENAPPLDTGAPAPSAVPAAPLVTIQASVWIDATYEGDLMAKAGVSYTVGRESVAQYGEPLNGIRAKTPQHQFLVKVDPYEKPGDPTSGLLPLIQNTDGGTPGEGDKSVQAYNFRLCLTKNADNKLPISAPKGYDPHTYEILARHIENCEKAGKKLTLRNFLKIDMMPGGKTDINNNGAVSTDFIGMSYSYPDGDYATRSKLWNQHLSYIQGLLYFIATSPRVPQAIREDMAGWGLCKDEFTDTLHWPNQMYIREARRMVGPYVVTQSVCEHKTTATDSIGMGAYNMDSHNCQRVIKNGAVENEGDVQVGPKGPYPISYQAITPKPNECENLLVPVCLSASHIAYGSIRMEPVFMALGQSAATAACQSIDEKTTVQKINYPKLRESLLSAGQVLEFTKK
jgi:hypothetical protein